MADPNEKKKSITKKRSLGSIVARPYRKSVIGRKKSMSPKMSEYKEDSFKQWEELKEDMDIDNYIYELHDEMVNKALEEIRKKRLEEERIKDFVDSFCNAWLKLVKWRWMVKDDKGKDIVRDDEEPTTCPKDPWSSRSYGEPAEVKFRTALPPPLKCCPHPPLQEAQEQTVEKPIIERVIRTHKKDVIKQSVKLGSFDSRQKSKMRSSVTEPLIAMPHMPAIPKTAFPEKAMAKIFMGPQVADRKKGASAAKAYASEIDLTNSQEIMEREGRDFPHYRRLE